MANKNDFTLFSVIMVTVQFNSAWFDLPVSTILSWVGIAVNVSDVISVGKLPNVEISGTPRTKEWYWVGTNLKRSYNEKLYEF